MLILLLLALRATSADENDVYASDDNFVSPTQTADAAEAALAARPREPRRRSRPRPPRNTRRGRLRHRSRRRSPRAGSASPPGR